MFEQSAVDKSRDKEEEDDEEDDDLDDQDEATIKEFNNEGLVIKNTNEDEAIEEAKGNGNVPSTQSLRAKRQRDKNKRSSTKNISYHSNPKTIEAKKRKTLF